MASLTALSARPGVVCASRVSETSPLAPPAAPLSVAKGLAPPEIVMPFVPSATICRPSEAGQGVLAISVLDEPTEAVPVIE